MSNYESPLQSPKSDGRALNWVLDHVTTHEETYGDIYPARLPLRTIFTLNCQTGASSPNTFRGELMKLLSDLPAQPCTLPPIFLTSFIKKCFPADFASVDFDQALTALDYLRDLDMRRKNEVEKAMKAKGQHDTKIKQMQNRLQRLDLLYAKALVGIRRFTLIHELSAPKFSRVQCSALLNTLYPLEEEDINLHLTAPQLSKQRQALWGYIIGVQQNGPGILDAVKGHNGGWKQISEVIHAYCKLSLELIQKAEDMTRPISYGSFQSDISIEEPQSPRISTKRRDSDSRSSEGEFEGSGRRSTLDKLVRGLQLAQRFRKKSTSKLGNSEWNSSKGKLYQPEFNSSQKGLSQQDWQHREEVSMFA
ncbi:hypothetical protein BZA77DRAFT_112605 [Pyronema omphalodes]|nr:hypothetical protein BZA77DRAFT_112605 [Pyronema omphalodes]